MNSLTIALVLIAALLHATWNLFAKRTNGGAAVVWLYRVISVAIYAPLAFVILMQQVRFNIIELALIFVSGCAHLTYLLLLQRGYRSGDLSLVYPLARGIGPLFSTTGAIVLFRERPSLIAFMGMLLIVSGAFLMTGGPRLL